MIMNNEYYLPQMSWSEHEKLFRLFVEGDESPIGDDFAFLKKLGFISDDTLGAELTELGQTYYDARFIRSDTSASNEITKSAILKFPPAEVLLQLLHGVENAKRDNALAVLKSRGFWCYADETPLTHFLLLLNQVGLITYSKKHRTLRILHNVHDGQKEVPQNIFIDNSTPYSNIEWLRRILSDCSGYIYWLDKHFLKQGLSYIWEVADANKVTKILIISLFLKEHDKSTIKEYRRFKEELANKGITLEWLVIDSTEIRDTHDRWILSKNVGWNLPNLGTILSGSRSEINKSLNHDDIEKAFKSYYKKAKEIGT